MADDRSQIYFCRDHIHTPAQRLHLALRVCRRELLAMAHPDTESVATSAPLTSRLHTWEVLFSEVELQQLLVSSGEYARIR